MLLTAALNALNTMSTRTLVVLSILAVIALVAIGTHHHAKEERYIANTRGATPGYYTSAPAMPGSWIATDKTTTATFADPCGLESVVCPGE